MKWGVIARADDRGLGVQTWEVCRNLNPDRVLVVRERGSEAQGFVNHFDRFPDATVATFGAEFEEQALVRDWIDGLDVIYSAETLYDWRLAEWARDQRCATVVHCNPEFFRTDLIAEPDAWWAPTGWRRSKLPRGVQVVPMPVPVDRWPAPDFDDCPRRVLHVAGRIATKDRNGTEIVMQAAPLLDDIETVIHSQTPLDSSRPPVDNYWELYSGFPVLLMPRRYGGLCLPVQEACGAGLVAVMPDADPNRMWPAELVEATAGRNVLRTQAGTIHMHDTDPHILAGRVNRLFDDGKLPERRRRARQWAEDNSWENRAEDWLQKLDRVRDRRRKIPPPKPSVSVIIPWQPSSPQREAALDWIRRRYSQLHSKWEVIVGEHEGEWSKGTAVADAVKRSRGQVLVVSDADVFLEPLALERACAAALNEPWVVPHNGVFRMKDQWTRAWLDGLPSLTPDRSYKKRSRLDREPYDGFPGGGMVILTREAFNECPGPDPRFVGWGAEDVSWGYALDTVLGRHVRLEAELWHLWHPFQANHKRPGPESRKLHTSYVAAQGIPRLMRALVHGAEPDPPEELLGPATFTADVASLVLIVADRSIRFRDGQYRTNDPDIAAALRHHPRIQEVC